MHGAKGAYLLLINPIVVKARSAARTLNGKRG